jgi:hypothetical protein
VSGRSHLRYCIDGLFLAALSLAALYATARIGLTPRDPERGVAVIYAPWTTPEAAIVRTVAAGGRFVRFGGPAFVAIAIPDDTEYSARVLAAGALLVVDPQVIAACLNARGAAAANP